MLIRCLGDVYAYGVSKRAVASLSTSISKDVLSFGIRVNTVSPGNQFHSQLHTFCKNSFPNFPFLIDSKFQYMTARRILKSTVANLTIIAATRTPMLPQFFPANAGGEVLDTGGFNLVEPEDIAQAIIWLLSEDSSKVSGINMPVGDCAP
jgi:chanoclavine-I dehydrogenase